jgi:hypothetical protein
MSPKQENRENSPYICAYDFHLILHICTDIVILTEFPLQHKDQGNNHTHTHIYPNKIKQGLASKLYKN